MKQQMTIRRCAALILGLMGILLWLWGMRIAFKLDGTDGVYELRWTEEQKLSADGWQHLEDTEMAAAFVREHTQSAEAPLFLRQRTLTLVEVAGDPTLLFLPGWLLVGNYPIPGEAQCLVDRESARYLWGSDGAIGQVLSLEKIEYRVSGVLEFSQPLMLVSREEPETFSFTSVICRTPTDAPFPAQLVDSLRQSLNLPVPSAEAHRGWIARLARTWALLPGWITCILAAGHCLIPLIPGRRIMRWGCLAAIAAGMALLLDFPQLLTPEMLPTRWSDFSFWPLQLQKLNTRLFQNWMTPGSFSCFLLVWEVLLPSAALACGSTLAFLLAAWLFEKSCCW